MTKKDIINQIAANTDLNKDDVKAAVESFFEVIKDNMSNGDNVYIRGFGSFVNKKRPKKVSRTISGKPIVLEERYVPTFKPAKVFVEKVKRTMSS